MNIIKILFQYGWEVPYLFLFNLCSPFDSFVTKCAGIILQFMETCLDRIFVTRIFR